MSITIGFRGWKQLQDERRRDELLIDDAGFVATRAAIIFILTLFFFGFIEGVEKTAKQQEKETTVYKAHYYQRPAAFRLASPTPEQMEHLHAMMQIQEVLR